MSVKTITSRIFPVVTDLEAAQKTMQKVLHDTLAKYRNEHNVNVIDEAHEHLDGFVYVPVQYTLWEGRFVRYIDARSPLQLKFKLGGFVVRDNSYTVTLKNDFGIYRVDKRSNVFFMKLSNKDLQYIEFRKLL